MVNYQWTDTIQVSSTHSAQFSSPSFSFSSSSASINDGQTAYFNITGSDQSSVTVPSCTGCKQFFFRPDGTQLGIYSGGLVKETIPLPGGETAVYNGSGLNFIRHTDYLGSSRLATTWAHAVYSKEAYAPFGETYNEAGTPDRSFTGQDQDVASGAGGTGTYDFLFRKYDPAAGRWLSPDPAGWGVVDQTAPQSLNRYAYVLNDPLALTDQNGTCWQTVTYSNSFNGGQVSNEDWSYDDGTGPCASDPGATLGASPGNGSTNSGGGSSGGSSSTQTAKVCFIPNPVEQTGIALQQKLANWLGYPVGVGMGVSGGVGFGKFFGFYATTSYQMVVTPTGNAYRVYTSGGTGITQNWLTPVTKGGGITGGFQVSSMTTQNPSDLSGYALNASAGGGRGWGGGGDVSVTGTANGSLVAQGTGTGPFGYGAFGGGGAITKTTVIPSCSNQ